ncbi:MAG: matrixin family metalloprotease, partial [Nitrososphaerales archaeon]|nr:matrixin family metalloprotease [Nitrososphaerales archaeon]
IGSAIISSARINPNFWKGFEEISYYASKGRPFFEKQFRKVLIHEFGHTLGLLHCNDLDCVMHYSNSPLELYRKGEWFCKNCWKKFTSIIGSDRSL